MKRLLPTWLALVAAAVVVDLAMVAAYVHLANDELGRSLAPSFPLSYKNWIMWAVFAPAIIAVVHKMLVARWSWARRIAASLVLGAVLAFGHAIVELQLHRMSGSMAMTHDQPFLSYHVFHGLLTFFVLYATALLVESERVARARELREVQLQEQLTRAQLHTLRMQLQPHFLFNTLNSISALIDQDVRGAQRMLSRLSDFLRMTLSSTAHKEVPLREELELLDRYVDVERARFGDRLRITYDVTADAREALVPNLLLQPLVENAIRHGIQPSIEGGTVSVRAYRDDGSLVIEVADDGVGIGADREPKGTGVGLANTRERLRQLYGTAADMNVTPRHPSGTIVIQRIPFVRGAEAR